MTSRAAIGIALQLPLSPVRRRVMPTMTKSVAELKCCLASNSIAKRYRPASWYAIPLRLIVGFGFIQHGYAKLARGPEDFIGVLYAMGLPSSFLLGWLTIIVELVGGLMILVGASDSLSDAPNDARPVRRDHHGAPAKRI